MFSSLKTKFNQPIGVFASHNSTNSLQLAKLILAAITSIENAGGMVMGMVCDGAQTNRRVWTEFGISGKLNSPNSSIEHFCDENRRFFAFSDSPHLLKCVRNRLYNNKVLKVRIIYYGNLK